MKAAVPFNLGMAVIREYDWLKTCEKQVDLLQTAQPATVLQPLHEIWSQESLKRRYLI